MPRLLRCALATGLPVLAILAVTGCGSSGSSGSSGSPGSPTGDPSAGGKNVSVTLTPAGCQPKPAKVPAGPVTFTVNNSGAQHVSEAELLSQGIIVGEKENLAPGKSGTFSLRLEPGSYTISCPNAKKDTWKFHVTGRQGTSKQVSPQVRADLRQATSGYHDYVDTQVRKLAEAAHRFTAAVKAGDTDKAKKLYAPARAPYERIEPVAESFGNLDPDIDARINDVDNPKNWTGFHRIEKALWKDHSLKGMDRYANKLNSDIATLRQKTQNLHYQPAQLANGATSLLDEVLNSKITGEEDRYSHTDLSDFEANVRGSQKAFDLLKPALKQTDPSLARTIDQRFGEVFDALKQLQGHYADTGYVNYATVGQKQRQMLSQKVGALAEPLSKVAATVTG